MKDEIHLEKVKELWIKVARLLQEKNIETVLVGGAVAVLYTKGKYKTKDLDFVINGTHEEVKEIMENGGFNKFNGYFQHADYSLTIDFTTKPLEIGYDFNLTPLRENETGLKVLTPTDCIKDRLANYLYQEKGPEEERKGLKVAIWVAQENTVDKAEIKRWCISEGADFSTIFSKFCHSM